MHFIFLINVYLLLSVESSLWDCGCPTSLLLGNVRAPCPQGHGVELDWYGVLQGMEHFVFNL